jgi:hypothetical protein
MSKFGRQTRLPLCTKSVTERQIELFGPQCTNCCIVDCAAHHDIAGQSLKCVSVRRTHVNQAFHKSYAVAYEGL